MRRPLARWLPVALFAATLVLEIASVALSWGLEARSDTLLYAVYSTVMAGAGAAIAIRHPRNAIGWLFCGFALLNALAADVAQGWGLRGAELGWPGVSVGEWIATSSWIPSGLGWILTFLLFPDGRLADRRWRWVIWAGATGALLAEIGWSSNPRAGTEFVGGRNPYAVTALPTAALLGVGMVLLCGALAASALALVARLRRAQGIERLQLKWFAFAAAFAVVVLPLTFVFWDRFPVFRTLTAVAITALPLAAGMAILRYRLYDIDLVISRTVLYATLTVLLAAAYGASALLLGIAVGRGSAGAAAGATLVVAVAFRPVRDRVQRAVDRRFSRARYDALARITRFLDDLRAGRAAPEAVEAVMREAVGDPGLDVRFVLPESGLYVDSHGVPVAAGVDDRRRATPIRRGRSTLGVLVHDATAPEHAALVPVVVEAGGLAVEIACLRVELRRQLDEVRASRARIVAVGEAERRRVERDLHDGAQQRLVSIGLALRHAQHELGGADLVHPPVDVDAAAVAGASRTIDGAVAEIAVAIDELRELARGLRPAQLDAGLGPALRELAGRVPLAVEVTATSERFPPDLETAAYFIACEGLTNAVKHARATKVTVDVARGDGRLVVLVADDGVGGASPRAGSGLTGLSDRVAAHGGTLRIEGGAGCGTRLEAAFPCAS